MPFTEMVGDRRFELRTSPASRRRTNASRGESFPAYQQVGQLAPLQSGHTKIRTWDLVIISDAL